MGKKWATSLRSQVEAELLKSTGKTLQQSMIDKYNEGCTLVEICDYLTKETGFSIKYDTFYRWFIDDVIVKSVASCKS